MTGLALTVYRPGGFPIPIHPDPGSGRDTTHSEADTRFFSGTFFLQENSFLESNEALGEIRGSRGGRGAR